MNKYFAFISYKREDEEWAVWFHHELENYHLPATLNGRNGLPTEFRPVFRDTDELKAGNLSEQIHEALASSRYLIVICSPNAAKSAWVNKEIREFIEIGKSKGIDNVRNIFPFIVDGKPHAKGEEIDEECFPKALLDLEENKEIVGGNVNEISKSNVNENGRDKAFVKVLAGMLPNVDFSELWNRYERDKAEQERLKREERERFLCIQSRFVSEKILDITDDSVLAQLLSLKILPTDLQNPNRPYTIEAEHALRQSSLQKRILLARYGATVETPKIAFNSDGKLVAVLTDEFRIQIWDSTTGNCIASIDTEHPFGKAIAFTPDTNSLLAIFGDGALIRWETETWTVVSVMDINHYLPVGRASAITSFCISNSGEKMAFSTTEGDIVYFDFLNDTTNSIEIDPVYSTAFSPNEKYLVTTSDKGLQVWDLEKGSCGTLDLNKGVEITNAKAIFNPKSNSVAYFFDNFWGTIDITATNDSKWQKYNESKCVAISFLNSSNDIAVFTEDGIITVWNIESHEQIIQIGYHVGSIEASEFSSDGSLVAYIDDNKRISIANIIPADLKDTQLLRDRKLTSIDFHPDGVLAVMGTANLDSGDVIVFDFEGKKILNVLNGHSDRVFSARYSPNGEIIATASYDGNICLWDSSSGECIKILDVKDIISEETAFTTVSFNRLGTLIAAATYKGDIIVWDYRNSHILNKFSHTSNPVYSVQFSPDGTYLASAGIDNNIKIWCLSSGKLHKTLRGHDYFVKSVNYSPNGECLFSASDDNTLICWNPRNGEIIWRNANWYGQLTALALSNDGKYLAVSSCDSNKPICICDTGSGKIIVSYSGIIEPLNSLAFNPDGKRLVCVDNEGRIYIWEFPELQTLIESVKTQLPTRILTTEELKQFYLE